MPVKVLISHTIMPSSAKMCYLPATRGLLRKHFSCRHFTHLLVLSMKPVFRSYQNRSFLVLKECSLSYKKRSWENMKKKIIFYKLKGQTVTYTHLITCGVTVCAAAVRRSVKDHEGP